MGMMEMALKVICSGKCVKVTSEIYIKIEAQGNCKQRQEDMSKGRKVTGKTIYIWQVAWKFGKLHCKVDTLHTLQSVWKRLVIWIEKKCSRNYVQRHENMKSVRKSH